MIVHDVEQDSEAWHKIRCGIPTTSMAGSLVTSKAMPSDGLKDYALVLAKEALTKSMEGAFRGNKHTERGKELEPDACSFYEMIMGVEVRHVGIVTDDLMRYGSSPDGLVGDNGGVELKCLTWENHYKVMKFYKKHGCAPSTYIPQTQGEMNVCELDWLDLCYYHPDLPPVIIRQVPDENFVVMFHRQLKAVEAERNLIMQFVANY